MKKTLEKKLEITGAEKYCLVVDEYDRELDKSKNRIRIIESLRLNPGSRIVKEVKP